MNRRVLTKIHISSEKLTTDVDGEQFLSHNVRNHLKRQIDTDDKLSQRIAGI